MANQTGSTTLPITSAVLYPMTSVDANVVEFFGSFQGNTTSNPTVTRGGWFSTVTYVSPGHWRVQTSLNLPIGIVPGTPTGLLAEAFAWVVAETVTTAPVKYTVCQTTPFDVTTNINTFDILVYDVAGAALYSVTSADRVFFRLAFKNNSVTP